MATIELWVERLLPCACLALTETPFPACPECDGCGESYQEIEVIVEYAYHKASRGHRDRYGAQEEPDEDESVEILATLNYNKVEIELSEAELDRAEEKCAEDVESRRYNYAE